MASFVGAELRIDRAALSRFEFRVFEIERNFLNFRRVDENGNRFVVADAFDDTDERMPVVPSAVAVSIERVVEKHQIADSRSSCLVDERMFESVLVNVADRRTIVSDFLFQIDAVDLIDVADIGERLR